MKKLLVSLLLGYLVSLSLVYAESCDNFGYGSQEKVDCWQEESNKAHSQVQTLAGQIAYYDSQIKLAQSKITQTEEQMRLVTSRISQLEDKLKQRSILLEKQIVQTYKKGGSDPLQIIFGSGDVSTLLSQIKYLQIVQANNRKFLYDTQLVQSNYAQQKTLIEESKKKLDIQKKNLAIIRTEYDNLLKQTRNNEALYQKQLKQAQQELEALATSKFTGEKKVVKRGDIVGIMGNTGNSTGDHLHFGYYNLTESQHNVDYKGNIGWYSSRNESPVDILQSRNLYFEALSCDNTPQSQTKSIGNGSLPWPMNSPEITQCYGHTPYSYVYSGNFHHGLDMVDSVNRSVRAIDDGRAYFYRGSTSFGNNVRIFHSNGKMSLYLHLR